MAIKLADIASKASNISTIGGAVMGGVNLVKSLFGNSDKRRREQEAEQDARQLRMQGEFNKMGVANSKELADYEQMLKMKMWQDTNYSAQMKEAEKAGVSKAALMGAGGGSSAQGASVSGMSGGNAADAASAQGAATQNEMMQAQIRNMNADSMLKQAQAVKTSGVDTNAVSTSTKGQEIQNQVNSATVDAMIQTRLEGAKTERERARQLKLANDFEEWMQTKPEGSAQAPKQAEAWTQINLGVAKIEEINKKMEQVGAQINLWEVTKKQLEADTNLKKQLKTQLDKINPEELKLIQTEVEDAIKRLEILKKDPRNSQVGQYITFGLESLKQGAQVIGEAKGFSMKGIENTETVTNTPQGSTRTRTTKQRR